MTTNLNKALDCLNERQYCCSTTNAMIAFRFAALVFAYLHELPAAQCSLGDASTHLP